LWGLWDGSAVKIGCQLSFGVDSVRVERGDYIYCPDEPKDISKNIFATTTVERGDP